ncbi:T9SS type A sorting domain-containing protein [Tamlana sp. 2_MG-2023]|uniref:T9SS type A sorting domain-containing protein n=1 Tax=unclassified Tamlana TaxID=2614803 RepID=UPI0026E1D362|nr:MULTISPECIES: T9SS type A sorting domain-containing protein [unclassified Tamlana]MDO6759396.1 T9SS type A sorting domain-containing protein [Tamlana sp. 2_MG-2023]MDO6790465.1 T9SS type A sorting domain-containing protein [Tamlana sp. 1_MG-2023]
MKKITLLLMVLGVMVYTTNLTAQTSYSVSMNGGTTYASNPGVFADYDWSGVGNFVFDNTNSSAITFKITDYDASNPEVGPELYIKLLRSGMGNGQLAWGSDNTTNLMTIPSADFTNGEATVTVSLPNGTLPIEQTADYESGYQWLLQVSGANGGGATYINYVSKIEEEILSSKDFNKNKLGAFYNAKLDAVVVDDALSGDYAIYDLTGRQVVKGAISSEISTSSLKRGIYILSTKNGALKFAK